LKSIFNNLFLETELDGTFVTGAYALAAGCAVRDISAISFHQVVDGRAG